MDLVILQNDSLRVEISPAGAEIQRIVDAQGVDRLWDGDPAFWSGRAPVLFPVAGAMKDLTYFLRGRAYTMERHGFARGRTFDVEASDALSATFRISGEHGQEESLPFAFAFRVRYTLQGASIRVDYSAENLDTETFYYGVGAHEAYACPEGIEAYEIVFDEPESLRRGVLAGGLLTRETEAVPLAGRALVLHGGLFDNDTLVFSNLNSHGVTLRSTQHDRTVHVDFDGFDNLLIWTVRGAGYICIEPWSNLPDYIDTDQDITKKPGMIKLVPGETRTLTHTITFG